MGKYNPITAAKSAIERWRTQADEAAENGNPGYWLYTNERLIEEAEQFNMLPVSYRFALDEEWRARFCVPLIDHDKLESEKKLVMVGSAVTGAAEAASQTEDTRVEISPERMLKAAEVTEIVGISRSTLDRMVRTGSFPQPLKPTAHRVWPASEVLDFVGTLDDDRKSRFASRYKSMQ